MANGLISVLPIGTDAPSVWATVGFPLGGLGALKIWHRATGWIIPSLMKSEQAVNGLKWV